jgi:sodium/pantothenate symporter
MAKNEHVVLRASIYACFAVIFLQILIYGAGGFINLAKYDIEPSETVMLWAAQNLVPPFLGALLLAGIVAAALSSASTFLSLVGFSVSNDLFAHRERVGLGTTRLLVGAVSVAVLILSLYLPPNVFWIMLFIGTVFASSWGPVGFMSIWSKRITAKGAFWGMVVGLLANIIPAGLDYLGVISLASYFEPALLGTVAGFLTIRWLSRGHHPSLAERDYLARLHATPVEDRDVRRTRITLIAPALLMLYGMAMPFVLLNFYVRPYQRGAGTILPGNSLNWSEAEPWIAFGPAALFIPLGLLAFVTIRRRYRPLDQGA